MPSADSEGWVRSLKSVSGTVLRTRGLGARPYPRKLYVVIKGIRPTSYLVDLYTTRTTNLSIGAQKTSWNHGNGDKWFYDCLQYRCRNEIVGLKFQLFDGGEFLGGCDFDISELPVHYEKEYELEMSGLIQSHMKGQKAPKKSRLFVTICIEKDLLRMFEEPRKALRASLQYTSKIHSLCCRIHKAKGLHGTTYPMCFVRCYMMSGQIITLHSTTCKREHANPIFDDTFQFNFPHDDKPLMLMFDILGGDAHMVKTKSSKVFWAGGKHLGTAFIPISRIGEEAKYKQGENKYKLPLVLDVGIYEKRMEERSGHTATIAIHDPKAALKAIKRDNAVKAQFSLPALGEVVLGMFGIGAEAESGNATVKQQLTMEAFVHREQVEDPYFYLLGEAQEFDDLSGEADEEIKCFFTQGVRRLLLTGEERIETVYGTVRYGSDLITPEHFHKISAYVVVEAMTTDEKLIFMYKTRVLKNSSYPLWDESFMFKVPCEDEETKVPVELMQIKFTVYDLNNHGEDMPIGYCMVDIARMRNVDYFDECTPLLGVHERAEGHTAKMDMYKRYSTLATEVRVERRVRRVVNKRPPNYDGLQDVSRHNESRPDHIYVSTKNKTGQIVPYRDLSQDLALLPEEIEAASSACRVLAVREKYGEGALAKRHQRRPKIPTLIDVHPWLTARPTVSKSMPELPKVEKPLFTPSESSEEEQQEDPEAEGVDSPTAAGDSPKAKQHAHPVVYRQAFIPQIQTSPVSFQESLQMSQAALKSLDYTGTHSLPPRRIRETSLNGIATRFDKFRYESNAHAAEPFVPNKEKKVLPKYATGMSEDAARIRSHFVTKPGKTRMMQGEVRCGHTSQGSRKLTTRGYADV